MPNISRLVTEINSKNIPSKRKCTLRKLEPYLRSERLYKFAQVSGFALQSRCAKI